MPDDRQPLTNPTGLSRRQLLGSMGAAAGAVAIAGAIQAGDSPAVRLSDRDFICYVRVAAVSYSMPFHDHRADGVNLAPLREMTAEVVKDRPDFICFPEVCTCVGKGFDQGVKSAPELEPYVAEVAKIAREFNVAIVAPFLERSGDRVYNSVPIVNRQGNMVLNYRKNYPTITELEAGVSPGDEIPVADCDGVRVGAAVCFDANFDHVAAALERQRARLVFWPSMYWGGQLLQHWALRYGFAVVVSYNAESAIIDMDGRYLARQGHDTLQVRNRHLPPWAIADIHINRELYHLDYNQEKLPAIRAKHGPDVEIDVHEPEGYFLLSSHRPDLPVEDVAAEFGLETNRDYLARSVKMRDERLASARR